MLYNKKILRTGLGSIEWPKFDFNGFQLNRMPQLRIGRHVASLPIVQGGMGVGISLSGLASAVANEGGIGVIAANSIGLLDSEYYSKTHKANANMLRNEIRKARQLTKGIIGVNIMVAVNDYQDLLNVAIEEHVDMVFLGAGLPIKNIPIQEIRDAGVAVVPIVSSGRAARLILASWAKKYKDIPDAFVVEGPKAGGHLGFKIDQIDDPAFSLQAILPDVLQVVKTFEADFDRSVPVIAAGGIYTGSDIAQMIRLGAAGVQMGTRFVATEECDAHRAFKEAYVDCVKDDIHIIKSPVGLPGRAIRNDFLRKIESGEKEKIRCAWKCLESCDLKNAPYCISLALDNARTGKLDHGFAFAGSNAWRVDSIVTVKDLIGELKTQYLAAQVKQALSLKEEYEKVLTKLGTMKDSYDLWIRNASTLIGEEYNRAMERITHIKQEYAGVAEKASLLVEELAHYLDWNNEQQQGNAPSTPI